MKKLLLIEILLTLIIWSNAICQNRDNIWVLSYVSGPPPHFSCGVNFNNGIADTFTIEEKELEFYVTNASVCDTLGELLFYTNGLYIANRNHDTLLNSHLFNDGEITDFYSPEGMAIPQGALILPRPDYPDNYLVFYQTGKFGSFYDKSYASLHLSMSEVDINLDGGMGGIVEGRKNIHLIEDTLVWGRLTACKHANGRDWWLISHKAYSDLYYKFLIQPDTIIGPISQHIGNNIPIDKLGMASFSPDGNTYAHLNYNDTLDILDFNRCTGEFSNPIFVEIPDSLSIGCAFSANNQFLYINQHLKLYQLDLLAADIPSSLILIGNYDGWTDPQALNLAAWFFSPQLGPDNKIYLSTWNSTYVLHTIEKPDNVGLGCDFKQHNFDLPSLNVCVPNFPNYDLGPIDNSECDTLYLNSKETENSFSLQIFPNPVDALININYKIKQEAILELYDLFGKRLGAINLYPYFKSRLMDVSKLSPGVYLAVATQNGKQVWSQKLIVQH